MNLQPQKSPSVVARALSMLLAFTVGFGVSNHSHGQAPVIFDTDITGDVDDVLALAMLHTLCDRGECDLRAITISKINPLTGRMVDAVNTFYQRPHLPVGVTRNAQKRDSKYLKLVQQRRDDGSLLYPHNIKPNEFLLDAVTMLRRTLAVAEDRSIVIIQVGLAANLADLLDSVPDDISSLNGLELIRQKVHSVEIMAGAFQPIDGNQRYLEANVRSGIGSMQRLTRKWPRDVPMIWSGFEIGIAVRYPRQSISRDFNYTDHHIVKEAYLLHSGPDHERPCWDLTSVLHAVRPDDGHFGLSDPGQVTVEDDGYVRFTPKQNGRDRYLTLAKDQVLRTRATLRHLVSQPPRIRFR